MHCSPLIFSLQKYSIVLLSTLLSLSSATALAASNADCENALKARDLNKAQSLCQQALKAQQQAASRNAQHASLDAQAKAHHNLSMLNTLLGKTSETERHLRLDRKSVV